MLRIHHWWFMDEIFGRRCNDVPGGHSKVIGRQHCIKISPRHRHQSKSLEGSAGNRVTLDSIKDIWCRYLPIVFYSSTGYTGPV